jgi:hypothetical protein
MIFRSNSAQSHPYQDNAGMDPHFLSVAAARKIALALAKEAERRNQSKLLHRGRAIVTFETFVCFANVSWITK